MSRKQEQAVALLLSCATVQQAAQQCGISESTLYTWLKTATFQAAYREARRAVVQHAIALVQAACGEAVETLRAILRDVEAPASARVSAARTILETSLRAIELEDIELRVAALERQRPGG